MKYQMAVKHRRGCYWWIDQKSFDSAPMYEIKMQAESDDEAIYNAALFANTETLYSVYNKGSLTAYDISSIESNWGYYTPPCKLETLMDHPLKYLNNNNLWLSTDGAYVQYIKNIDTDTIVWKDKTIDPDYNGFETPHVFTAWYGTSSNLEKGKLTSRQSRSFYSPNKGEAIVAAATKISCNYYRDGNTRVRSEPSPFSDMLYEMSFSSMKMLLNGELDRASDMTCHGLYLGLIQNSDNICIWRSHYMKKDPQTFPDRSVIE